MTPAIDATAINLVELFVQLLLGCVGGLALVLIRQLFKRIEDLERSAQIHAKQLAEHKLYAAERFVSIHRLQKVEERLTDELRQLRETIQDQPRQLAEIFRHRSGEGGS